MQDPKHGARFSYDDQGERKLKKSQYGEVAYINQFFTVRNGAIASTHVYAGTSRIVTKVGAGTPVGKVANLKGTGNLDPNAPTGGDIVVGDIPSLGSSGTPVLVTTRPGSTTPTTGTTTTPSPLAGPAQGAQDAPEVRSRAERGIGQGPTEGRGEGAAATTPATTSTFPGQGLEHRSDRANEVARNTEKNKHLNGGDAGGDAGSSNSNAGGNGNPAGSSNNPGSTGGSNAGGNGGGTGGGSDNTSGNTNGNGNGGGGGGGGQGNGREFIYFYHPDHLGSTGYVTDEKALRYEHITYFPFGETWVQESNATWRVPYQFTSKEMDQETGLYYFGARYYDPRTSVWQSADPILGKYLPNAPTKQEEIVKLQAVTVQNSLPHFNLPGMGGVFNTTSLNMFAYAAQNPVKYVDPDGRNIVLAKLAEWAIRFTPTVTAIAAEIGGVNGTLSTLPAVSTTVRALTAADLGIQGAMTQMRGGISMNGSQLNITVDMIEGGVKNIYKALPNLIDNATRLGATEIRIEATLAEPKLLNVLANRFGMTISKGEGKYQDVITIPILVNQIPQ